jgi:hypothetical protein
LMGAMATAEPTNIPLDSALTPFSCSSACFWASSAIPDTVKATANAQKNAQKSDKINGEKEHSNNNLRTYPGPRGTGQSDIRLQAWDRARLAP